MYVGSKQRAVEKVGPLKDNLGNIVTDNRESASLLNNYFITVFTRKDVFNIPEPIQIFEGDINIEGLLLTHVTSELVFKN